jgi:hypothetical protein
LILFHKIAKNILTESGDGSNFCVSGSPSRRMLETTIMIRHARQIAACLLTARKLLTEGKANGKRRKQIDDAIAGALLTLASR